jgi:dTDP-4-dehydrorhamnose reductase
MTLLIVGANGQVGSELRLRQPDAICLDRAGLDITRRDDTLTTIARLKPSAVINSAAYTAVDKAEKDVEAAFAVNRDGAAHLAEACGIAGIPLLHISTDYVFDGTKKGAYLETDPASPQGIYARSKWEGEQRIRQILPRHFILRVSWVFGAQGNNFVKTILRLARERPELRIVADQHGCPTSAASIAESLLRIAQLVIPAKAEIQTSSAGAAKRSRAEPAAGSLVGDGSGHRALGNVSLHGHAGHNLAWLCHGHLRNGPGAGPVVRRASDPSYCHP